MRDEALEPFEQRPLAVVLGCAGERLSLEEPRFFAAADPLGFVLFRRNCSCRDQLRDLVAALRGAVGRADAPVLIDQEGGRVARLGRRIGGPIRRRHIWRRSRIRWRGEAARLAPG